MLTFLSKKIMSRSFKKTIYRFRELKPISFKGNFGVYLHVPFCYSKCSFCPFYKEIYNANLKKLYLETLQKEIKDTDITGTAKWVYFGGGTPNTLSLRELSNIVSLLTSKVTVEGMGIELLPGLLTSDYLNGLKEIGFTKVSIGIESFSKKVSNLTGRTSDKKISYKEIIELAKKLGLWINVDLMVGLPGQNEEVFIEDISGISYIQPNQVTIYPYMSIRNNGKSMLSEKTQFRLIEQAANQLISSGYTRKGIWIFAQGDELYDSSRDELIEDYVGFGPAAFSTGENYKIVNPDLFSYVFAIEKSKKMAFIAPKTKTTDDWRKFAKMIYDLRCEPIDSLPEYINSYIKLLKTTGYCKNGHLTKKGIFFAHALTKTVVESLPFPLQNPSTVENYSDYMSFKNGAIKKVN